jgi:hypothetical protein
MKRGRLRVRLGNVGVEQLGGPTFAGGEEMQT